MRRKNREIRDMDRLTEILNDCDCCRIALADQDIPYIVPLNFGYNMKDGKLTFYFHGAAEGRKMGLIKENGRAGFELDTGHALKTHEKACGHSFYYRSITGHGKIMEVTDSREKEKGLQLIMKQLTQRADWDFDTGALEKTAVLKLEAEEYCGKEYRA